MRGCARSLPASCSKRFYRFNPLSTNFILLSNSFVLIHSLQIHNISFPTNIQNQGTRNPHPHPPRLHRATRHLLLLSTISKTKLNKFFRLPQLERGEAPSKEGQSLQRGRRKGGKTDRPACLGRLWTTAAVIRIDGFPRFLNGRLLATSRTGDNEARQTDKLYHGRIRRCTGRR